MNINLFLNLKKFFNFTNIFLIILFGILAYILRPVLVNQVFIGWDLPAHYYLVEQMLNYLEHWRVSGYNIYGYAGFPMFVFYNPLPYIAVCLLHLLSFKFIPIYLCFNIVLFVLPFIYLLSVYYASNAFFNNQKINLYALLFGFCTLFLLGNNGLGLASEFNVGLFTNAFAWPLLLFLMGVLEKLRRTGKIKYLFWAIGLFSALILTHIFTTIFAAFILLVYLIFYFKQAWKPMIIFGIATLALTAFWWLPFILNISYASADPIVGTSTLDPIFGIYPKYFFGLILFIFSFIGIIALIKEKKYFFPFLFLFSLIIIPRSIFYSLSNIPIHYYRFTADIALINVFISAYGFNYLIEWINAWKIFKKGQIFSKIPWVIILILYLFCLIINLNLSYFNYKNFQNQLNPKFEGYAQELTDIDNLVKYIKDYHLEGRFLPDTNSEALLTKHYFDYIFPKNNIFDMRGLFYDSSLSGRFLYTNTATLFDYTGMPTIIFINNQNDKEVQTIAGARGNTIQKLKNALGQASTLGVKYLIVDNKKIKRTPVLDFVNSQYNQGELKIKKTIGRFTLIEIKNSAPLIGKTDYHPFLFIESDGLSKKIKFWDFAYQWYNSDFTIDYPVIFANKPFEKISDYDKSQIGGYIVSYRNKKEECPSQKQMDYWIKQDKPVIFLDSKTECPKPNNNIYFIKDTNDSNQVQQAHDIIAKLSQDKFEPQEIEPELIQNEKIKFNSHSGTLVNFSYFPKWQSNDKDQTVFWISPSMMFVFGRGKTELNYK